MGNEIAVPNIRRSLHIRIENYDGLQGYKSLNPNNQDIVVVKKVLTKIGYEPTEMWKDTMWFQPPFYDKIMSEINGMLWKTRGAAQGSINPYQVNLIQIQGHGVMYQNNTLVVVPTLGEDGKMSSKFINVNNIANQFAEEPFSFNIFLVDACRV
jgi:hypothetical protein